MIKKVFMIIAACALSFSAQAQEAKEKKFDFKFYGRIRGDLMYNSRASQESVDGLFYMFPLDKNPDAGGRDLNAVPASNFYMLYTRLGVDIKGLNIGSAKASAKVEVDFRGSSTSYSIFRLRQAYVNLAWERHELLIGQTWHPLTGDVTPSMLNLSTGAPYQPFSRTPMLRYRLKSQCGLQLTFATMWQMQYNSTGPDGKSFKYLKNSCVPELYAGLDYKHKGWIVGAGVDFISLTPRQSSTVSGNTYKVSERINAVSAEAHVKYKGDNWSIAAKNIFGENLAHASMLGGYAVSKVDATTGEQEYTPYRHNSTWVNFVYGKKWQPSIFLGYTKNLGTSKDIAGASYGTGLNIDQLAAVNVTMSYNLPHWKVGVELEPTIAWYGTPDQRGRVKNTHTVTNFRALAVAMFIF